MDSLSQAFFELSGDMVGIMGFDWRPIKLNSIWEQHLGWSLEELYGMCFKDLVHPDDISYVTEKFKGPEDLDKPCCVTLRYLTKEGPYKYLSWNFIAKSSDKKIVAIVRDVTRQAMYEEILKQTNKSARVGVWNIGVQTQSGYWSPEIYDMFGLDPKKDVLTLYGCSEYFGEADNALIKESFNKLLSDGTGYDIEATVISKTGSKVPVRIVGSGLKENGVVTRAFGVMQDISYVKEGDRALRYQQYLLNGLLDASPSIFYVKDLEGRYILVNRRFEELLGRPRGQLLGKSDFDLFEKRDALRHLRSDHKIIEKKETLKAPDEILLDSGLELHFLSEKFPLLDENGKVVAIAGVSTDISELHKYQQELVKAKELAEAGTRAKSEFLTNMSHEIRTPMNSIIGMAEILLDSNLDTEQIKVVQIMGRAAESLMQIINDILDLSKIEAGVMNFEHVPFTVREVVKRATELLMVKAVEKKLSLEYEVMPDVPEKMTGDFMKVQQVLINLIANGLKFTSFGGVKVVVSLEQTSIGKAVRFSIRDTGIGLDPDNKKTIFARFAQADSSITRRFGGTGLGLSISQELVVRMGGVIGVESQLGQGSEFYFCLPCS
ncbi:PAS domain-containing hybrid sensor histidine kinase/response regulator [Bdellovibrio bacteriovorus]|nr:PAS domain S-box protein [Bdellovibrio bacteriovorus]